MVELTENPIDYSTAVESVRSRSAGAVVLFMGTVREFTGDVQTASLHYDAYPEMALVSMQKLEAAARDRWPLTEVTLIHRTGHLELGEIAVAVAVSAGHRREAFEAGQWLIDTLKEEVPIWKKENYRNGGEEWIHPEAETDAASGGTSE